MSPTPLHEIIPVLQTAIGPVILISGAGLLLLPMANRLGRAIDRARSLVRELRGGQEHDRPATLAQVAIIYRRAWLIRLSIVLAALLIIVLFLTALMKWDYSFVICLMFIACLGSLIASLVAFTDDLHLPLVALKLDLKPVGPEWV